MENCLVLISVLYTFIMALVEIQSAKGTAKKALQIIQLQVQAFRARLLLIRRAPAQIYQFLPRSSWARLLPIDVAAMQLVLMNILSFSYDFINKILSNYIAICILTQNILIF